MSNFQIWRTWKLQQIKHTIGIYRLIIIALFFEYSFDDSSTAWIKILAFINKFKSLINIARNKHKVPDLILIYSNMIWFPNDQILIQFFFYDNIFSAWFILFY